MSAHSNTCRQSNWKETRPLFDRTSFLSAWCYTRWRRVRMDFQGKSPASIVAAILGLELAPVTTLQPTSPLDLDRLIRTALAKNPDKPWRSGHDIGIALAGISTADYRICPVPWPDMVADYRWSGKGCFAGIRGPISLSASRMHPRHSFGSRLRSPRAWISPGLKSFSPLLPTDTRSPSLQLTITVSDPYGCDV